MITKFTATITTTLHYTALRSLHRSTLQLQRYMQLQLLHCITQLYTTLHDTNYITLRYIYNCNYNYNDHYIALRYTTLITAHYYYSCNYNYNYTTLHYTTLDYITLYHTTVHNTPVHTIYYTNYTTPQLQLQLQLQLHCTNFITLKLQLTTTTPLHDNYNYNCNYNYNYNCTTPRYIQQLW